MTSSRSAQVGAAALLTGAACLAGALGWPVPQRTLGGWQVADVPPSLFALVLATCGVSLVAGAVLTRPWSLGTRLASLSWWVLGLASLAVQVWNDLYLAALSTAGDAIIPVLGWVFTAVPAFLVGRAARGIGREEHLRATIGTGVVTLPPVGLGWALATGAGGLWSTVVLGVLPLVFAIAITRPSRLPAATVG